MAMRESSTIPLSYLDPGERGHAEDLIRNARGYLEKADNTVADFLQQAGDHRIQNEELTRVFRTLDRLHQRIVIVQYLLTFLQKLPAETENQMDPARPFQQFHWFVQCQLDLLRKRDVIKLVLEEFRAAGDAGDREIHCLEYIKKCIRIIDKKIKRADRCSVRSFCALFEALRDISQFWFQVKRQDPRKYRRSDRYIHELCGLLLKKHDVRQSGPIS